MSSERSQVPESQENAKGENRVGRGRRLKEKALEEFRQVLVMFLYLWLLFGLFAIHETIVLAQHDIPYKPFGVAAVNAFVLAKVMLVAQKLDPARRLRNRPLIYPVLFQAIVFAIVFIAFHFAEHVVIGVWHGKSVEESVPGFGTVGLKGILAVGVIMTVMLIPFFAFREVARVIGPAELRAMLLTRGAAARLDPRQGANPKDG